MIPYEILIRGNAVGGFQGAHAIDAPGGVARAITQSDLTDLAPAINAEALAFKLNIEAEIAAALDKNTDENAITISKKHEEIDILKASVNALEIYRDTMVQRVTEALESQNPATQFELLAIEFLTPEKEKARAAKMAQLEELKLELGL